MSLDLAPLMKSGSIPWPILICLIHSRSNKGQKRASEWDGELPKQDEALKKRQPAYYTVTINKGFSLQFSWKDAKGKIGAFDKV